MGATQSSNRDQDVEMFTSHISTPNQSVHIPNAWGTNAAPVTTAPAPSYWSSATSGCYAAWGSMKQTAASLFPERVMPASWKQKYLGTIGANMLASLSGIMNYVVSATPGKSVFLLANNSMSFLNAVQSVRLWSMNSYLMSSCMNQVTIDCAKLDELAEQMEAAISGINTQEHTVHADRIRVLSEEMLTHIETASDVESKNKIKLSADLVLATLYLVRIIIYFITEYNKNNKSTDSNNDTDQDANNLMIIDTVMTVVSCLNVIWGQWRCSATETFKDKTLVVAGRARESTENASSVLNTVVAAGNIQTSLVLAKTNVNNRINNRPQGNNAKRHRIDSVNNTELYGQQRQLRV